MTDSGESFEPLSQRAFYWRWVSSAFTRLRWLEPVEGAIVAVAAAVVYFSDRLDGLLSVVVWALPLTVLVGSVIVRLALAPFAIYRPVAEQLEQAVAPPSFPSIEFEKCSQQRQPSTDSDGRPWILFIRGIRITNREAEKVSLGFKLNVQFNADEVHLGIPCVIGPLRVGRSLVPIPRLPLLESPLDLDARSTVQGNIAFALAPDLGTREGGEEAGHAADAPPDPGFTELEVTEFVSRTMVRFSPAAGYPLPDGWPEDNSIAARAASPSGARRIVTHESM